MRFHGAFRAIRTAGVTGAAVALASLPLAALAAQVAGDARTRPAIDQRFVDQVREALRQNPDIIFEAAEIGQRQQRERQETAQRQALDKERPVLFATRPFGPVIGNPAAGTTVAEFLDYRCGFCKRAAPLVDKVAADSRDIRFVVVMRPVLGPDSETMARFALAASRQGRFAQVHDALYALPPGPVTDEVLRGVADRTGVDFARAKTDMTGDAVVAELGRHQAVADRLGVTGTPFFVTPRTAIPGAPSDEAQLRAAISGS